MQQQLITQQYPLTTMAQPARAITSRGNRSTYPMANKPDNKDEVAKQDDLTTGGAIFHMDTFDPESLLADLPPPMSPEEIHAAHGAATTLSKYVLGDKYVPPEHPDEDMGDNHDNEGAEQGELRAHESTLANPVTTEVTIHPDGAQRRWMPRRGEVMPREYLEHLMDGKGVELPERELGSMPIHRRAGGRIPALFRDEVEQVVADANAGKTLEQLAAHWGVSQNTIRRVLGRGVFGLTPYVPADEYDRTRLTQSMPKYRALYNEEDNKIGRPFKSRQGALTKVDIQTIAWSVDRVRDVAERFHISAGTVNRIRREMRGTLPPGVTLQQAIAADM